MINEQMSRQIQPEQNTQEHSTRPPGDWILQTKLNPPLIRSDILDRPRLIAKLERNRSRCLTLISSPAGYGKSTLAAQWLEKSSLPGAWVSLDESDNNPRTFLGYVVAAVRCLDSTSCTRIHDLLDAVQLPPIEVLANLLANDLEEVSEPILLVLDDYHLITDPEIYDLLHRLLQHPPRGLHWVITTRRDPVLPLAAMLAQGMAVEIRESDLKFDADETGQVLERMGGVQWEEDRLSHIMDETEGWITGLRLFCLATETGDDPTRYLFGLRGGALHVQDYLVEQVLSRQHPALQEYLLKTSVLERFCASLCEAVCTGSDADSEMTGQQFIDAVSEANLFGIQLDPGGEWIRYHHLFQDLLRNHLQRKRDPNEVAELHRRAARWLAGRGLVDEGLNHALAAGDAELAGGIVEGARLDAMNSDQWPRLGKWLDRLPFGIENKRPHLMMCRCYVLNESIQFEDIPPVLDQIVCLEGDVPKDPMLAAELAFFRGIISFFTGEISLSRSHFEEACCTVPPTNLECRSESEYFSYVALYVDGQPERAVQGLKAALQRNILNSAFYQSRLMFGLGLVYALAGQWPELLETSEQMTRLARTNNLTYVMAWSFYMQGVSLLQMGHFKEAGQCFEQSIELRYIHTHLVAADSYIGLILSLLFRGEIEPVKDVLREAREFAHWSGDPAILDVVDAGGARVDLFREASTARWMASRHAIPEGPIKLFFLEIPGITVCRVLVETGTSESLDQAATQLDALEAEARQFHHHCQLVPMLVLKSLLYAKTDRLQDALETLSEAVSLAWPGRWVLPFVEGGSAVKTLLEQLPENPEWDGFVPGTLSRIGSFVQPESSEEEIITALTNRETEVIVLLCDRLYDKEIAAKLGISTTTVKKHLTRAYSKLGVANRREAVRKAGQLGLVQ